MNKWDLTSKKDIYKSELFSIEKRQYLLANNVKKAYDVVLREPTVVVFPLNYKNELFLVKQYRYLFSKRIIEAPAGYIDKGETPLRAAKRELMEETGIAAAQWEQMAKIEGSASVILSTSFLFLAREIDFKEPAPEDDEEIEVMKIGLSQAVNMVEVGEITNSATIIGILLLDRFRRDKKL